MMRSSWPRDCEPRSTKPIRRSDGKRSTANLPSLRRGGLRKMEAEEGCLAVARATPTRQAPPELPDSERETRVCASIRRREEIPMKRYSLLAITLLIGAALGLLGSRLLSAQEPLKQGTELARTDVVGSKG